MDRKEFGTIQINSNVLNNTLRYMGSVTYAQLADSNKSELFKNGDVVYCTDTQETYLYSNSTSIELPKEEDLNNKHKKMLPYPSNCKNCGAVMTG